MIGIDEKFERINIRGSLIGATFSIHAQQSEAFVTRTNVKLSALVFNRINGLLMRC